MGLIAKLKKMFSNNIIYSSENLGDFGGLYLDNSTKLKVGSSIVIEDNTIGVVAYKGEVRDYIHGKGKFRVDERDLPHLFEKAITKKNPEPKKIKADLYFINTNPIEKFGYLGENSFLVRSKTLGKVKGCVEGVCTVQLVSVRNLFDWLFLIKTKWRVGAIERIISREIGNAVARVIEKSKVDIEDIILKKVNINDCINTFLENAFDDLGFKVSNVELIGIEFDKKVQPKVNALIMQEYERVTKSETKYITIDTTVE